MGRPRLYPDDAARQRAWYHRQRHPTTRYLPAGQHPGIFTMDLAGLLASGQQFHTIYADPPWEYADKAIPRGGTARHYAIMSLEAIAQLPIAALAAPQAHLHLWVTKDFRATGEALLAAWDFTFKSETIWVKTTKEGKPIQNGIGHYYRMGHETCLLGVRGNLPRRINRLSSVLCAPRGSYSEKPEEMRDRIEQFSPRPYLELFGRSIVPGWTVWGNECQPRNGRLFHERL